MKKERKRYLIYKLTNKVNGKIYIGKTQQTLSKRLRGHLYYARGSSKTHLSNAINQHGLNNFDVVVLEKCSSTNELNDRERYWIRLYNSTDETVGYNITEGGTGGATRFGPHTEGTRAKMRKPHGPFTAVQKANMRAAAKSRPPRSKEAVAKMIQTKLKNGTTGFSARAREKARVAKLGHTWNKGKIRVMHVGLRQNRTILPEELTCYVREGWVRGLIMHKVITQEFRDRMREIRLATLYKQKEKNSGLSSHSEPL